MDERKETEMKRWYWPKIVEAKRTKSRVFCGVLHFRKTQESRKRVNKASLCAGAKV